MPKVEFHVRQLLEEANAKSIDLVRFGMSQGTAYNLTRERVKMIDLDTLALLCSFLSERLGRRITPGDILTLSEEN